jgi:hypothetical protein
VLVFWADVASDFSRFHRIRPIERSDLDAAEFFAMAYRLEVYGGAVALAAAKIRAQRAPVLPSEPVSFDEWVGSHQSLVIQQAAIAKGGD